MMKTPAVFGICSVLTLALLPAAPRAQEIAPAEAADAGAPESNEESSFKAPAPASEPPASPGAASAGQTAPAQRVAPLPLDTPKSGDDGSRVKEKKPSGSDDGADGEGEDGGDKAAKKLEVGGRLHASYRLKREAPSPTDKGRTTENEFRIRRANVQLTWKPQTWMKAVIQVDVAEAFELGTSLLTDAYLHFVPLPQLQLRIGQFKKPFSGIVLQSPSKLRIIGRGPGVDHIAQDLRYGDRDLGAQLSGMLVKSLKLKYAVGVFNGSGPNIGERGNSKDVAARLQIRPWKKLEIGANGSIKFIENPASRQPKRGFAGGGDARFEAAGFRLYAEGLVATDHGAYTLDATATANDVPLSFFVLAEASYRHKFKSSDIRIAVEPAFKMELFDPDAEVIDDHLWVFTPGINGYFGEYFKIMLNGEFTRSGRNAREAYPDGEAIEVLACFDI